MGLEESLTPVLGLFADSQGLISHSVQGEWSWASTFVDGQLPCKWSTSQSSQLRGSHWVSFFSLTILLYLIEVFLPLPTLLTFGFGSRSSLCRGQLFPLWLLSCFSSSFSSPGRTGLILLCGASGSLHVQWKFGGREGQKEAEDCKKHFNSQCNWSSWITC